MTLKIADMNCAVRLMLMFSSDSRLTYVAPSESDGRSREWRGDGYLFAFEVARASAQGDWSARDRVGRLPKMSAGDDAARRSRANDGDWNDDIRYVLTWSRNRQEHL
jgi:hypothetical protein